MAPATTPKRMSREARHASLLDAAAVILRAGEHPLTFETVAAVAGVSPTLPYKYFTSVDAIASELYGQLIDPIDEQTESLMADPAQTFDQKLRATLHLWCDILRTEGALLLRLSDDVAHPSLRKVIDARRERSVQVLADEIERECEINPTTARLVAGSISGGSIAALMWSLCSVNGCCQMIWRPSG